MAEQWILTKFDHDGQRFEARLGKLVKLTPEKPE